MRITKINGLLKKDESIIEKIEILCLIAKDAQLIVEEDANVVYEKDESTMEELEILCMKMRCFPTGQLPHMNAGFEHFIAYDTA